MITGLSIVTVWVLDCDSAKKFYTEQLGFTLTNDIELESGMRWLTVRPPGGENQELLLLDPLHSMLDEDTAQQVRALIAKGALSPGATLAERGVEFIQEPAERPYGIEALLRDDSGNWFSFCQRT
jgi:catechol 2,3-dioxygenase-like lactoylglutathione lyase family enzyme